MGQLEPGAGCRLSFSESARCPISQAKTRPLRNPIGDSAPAGLGQVYKARDRRLDRIVAIKTANEKFSERFKHGARAIAALNHRFFVVLEGELEAIKDIVGQRRAADCVVCKVRVQLPQITPKAVNMAGNTQHPYIVKWWLHS